MQNFIKLLNEDIEIKFGDEGSTLELLLKNKIDIDHSCGGMGSCGTCRIYVKSDLSKLPARNEIETERADDLQFKDNERLACQLKPFSNLVIKIP